MFYRKKEVNLFRARELVMCAVMISLCVAANVLCAHTVPLHGGSAMVILSGISMGPQAGVLIGALGRLICNFFDGQGPWTIWQMFAWGIIGGISGVVFETVERKTILERKYEKKESLKEMLMQAGSVMGVLLCITFAILIAYLEWLFVSTRQEPFWGWRLYGYGMAGLVAGTIFQRKKLPAKSVVMTIYTIFIIFIIYGGLMNIGALVMQYMVSPGDYPLTVETLKLLYISGVPYDLSHAIGAAVCIFFIGEPLLQKLERIQIKYGIFPERKDKYTKCTGDNMKNKKIASMILAVTMVFNGLSGNAFVKGDTAQETTKNVIVYVAVEGKNAEGETVQIDKTPVLTSQGSTATQVIQQVLDNPDYKTNYVISTSAWGDSLDEIGALKTVQDGENWYYWTFCINGNYADVGIGNYTVKDQDKISLIYSYDNNSLQADCFVDDASKNPTKEQREYLRQKAIKNRDFLAQKIYETTFKNGEIIPTLSNNSSFYYTVYSLKQAGFEAPQFYEAVYKQLEKDMNENFGQLEETILNSGYACPNYAKIILALTQMGYDATNVGGVNLIEKMTNKETYEASADASAYGTYGCEGMMLLALDAGNYIIPQGEDYVTREQLVNTVLKDVENGVKTSITWGNVDAAAMTIECLAPYSNQTYEGINQAQVQEACNQVIAFLGNMQAKNGYIGDSWTPNNVWSLAQVMNTAGKFNINILTEETGDFIKNGVTLLDNVSEHVDADKSFVSDSLMSYQPEQLLRGLNSVIKVLDSQKEVTDNDTKDEGKNDTKQETPNNQTAKISINKAVYNKIPAQTYTGKAIKPAVKVTYNGKTLKKGTDYQISYTSNKKLGTGKVLIKGIGAYEGSKTIKFSIKLGKCKTVKAKKKTGVITWKKVVGAKKYKVQISTNKNFKKNVITKTVKKNKVVWNKFKKAKTYYIRVCAVNQSNKSSYSKIVLK